jgi:hypothetical protein
LEEYRNKAATCARLALRFSDEKIKRGYEDLARAWKALADGAETPKTQTRERETA